jgi:nucleoside phosphorylase
VGRRRARAAADALLERSAAPRLIVVGVAGALTANLEVGALVVGRRLATESGESTLPDPAAVRLAVDRGARPATVVTVDRMVSTVAERQALLRALESESPAAAVVDMESWDAVAAAVARGVPATVVRVVSDGAGEALPAFLERCRRPDGDVDRRRVAWSAIARPASIPALLELRRRIRLCAEVLAEAVPGLLVCLVDG